MAERRRPRKINPDIMRNTSKPEMVSGRKGNAMLNEDLTAKEVAAILGVSPATMVVWRGRGEGPGWYQIGGRYRYPQRDLDQFINSIRTS